MFPELFRIGSVVIATKSIFLVLAFLTTAFMFWRKAREEHYHEEQVFDAFLLSVLVGMVMGRVGFVLFHIEEFSTQIWRAFDIVGRPGSVFEVGLIAATLYLFRFARQKKWDAFEVLDFWFLSVAVGMVLIHIGNFFAGVGFGYETSLPWGVVFPGVFQKHHPLQIYTALFFTGLGVYLSWAEYHYRTFTWYRAGKKTAQTGFLTSVFMIAVGAYFLATLFIRPKLYIWGQIPADIITAMSVLIIGLLLLYNRSGRTVFFWHKKDSSTLSQFK
jgi:phosphatidylglycerol---prolipoprotein diacylglyceryl transferase